jgi:RNA polymerase sigma-70 factor (ECF subfamily)
MSETTPISIEALKSGDREAFAEMVEAYSPLIYRLALRMLGDEHEAEDVLQETFLNAYRALDRFEGRSSLSTWLYRIATNQALMRLRKHKPPMVSVDEAHIDEEGFELPRQFTDWCCLPEDEFMSAEAQAMLKEAAEGLSPALRAAFVLRDLHGFSTREAAEILEISETALKTRLMRARLQLREQLSSYFSERVEELGYA